MQVPIIVVSKQEVRAMRLAWPKKGRDPSVIVLDADHGRCRTFQSFVDAFDVLPAGALPNEPAPGRVWIVRVSTVKGRIESSDCDLGMVQGYVAVDDLNELRELRARCSSLGGQA